MNGDFAVVSEQNGTAKVTYAYGDSFKVKDIDVMRDWAVLIFMVVGVIYALLQLLVRGGLDLFRLVFKKNQSKTPKELHIWTYLTSLAAVGVAVNFYFLFLALGASDPSYLSSWRYMVFAGLGLILAGCAVFPLLAKARKGLSKSRLFLTVMTSLSALAIVANILYWSLYQWWAL